MKPENKELVAEEGQRRGAVRDLQNCSKISMIYADRSLNLLMF